MSKRATFTPPSIADLAAMQDFWRFCEPHRASMSERTRAHIAESPAWAQLSTLASEDQAALQGEESHRLQMQAILDGRWEPYLSSLRLQGERFAQAGVSYAAWFELTRSYRDHLDDQITSLLRDDPRCDVASALSIARGMSCLINIATEQIGEAFLAARQQTSARSEELHRAMFDHSPLPMWTFDRATLRFVTVNEAAVRLYGYSRAEFASMTLADIRAPEEVEALRAIVEHPAADMTDVGTVSHRRKDGSTLIVELRVNDLSIDQRRVRLVLINDITERVRAEHALRKTEEQLQQAQKMEAIGRLAGGIAHDFNNMLTVMQSYAYLLEESSELSESRREDAAEIRRASERAAGITRQLLTLSRHSIVTPRPLNLDTLVANLVPLLRRLVGETVSILTLHGNVPDVIADDGQMEQVIMILSVNAADAMPAGGRLTLESRVIEIDEETANVHQLQLGRYVELAVTDTGHGMNADTQTRIFEPFYSTKVAGIGTGLGLSIAHGIVAQAGGRVSVYSEPGHGTTFRIQLPVASGVYEIATSEHIEAPRTLPPLDVLVVDDHADVRDVAARILRDAGCTVLAAATAEEARRICVSHEGAIDLVLLDVVLPDGRGDLLIDQLRELRPTMRFVLMSGYPVGALNGAGAPPKDLLSKPFSPSELRAAVARACGVTIPSATPSTSAPSGRYRALVADDDPDLRKVVARLLGKAGVDVVEVDSGTTAIKALEAAPFDVVLSDVHMPDGGGLDLLRTVRRVDLDVPVILMTGEPSVAAAAAAVEYGAFRYLTKPLDNAGLVSTVNHAARAHALARLRREAYNVTGAHAGIADRAGLEVRFDQALAGMWMAFQPIVHASNGALFGVEALLRSSEPSIPHPPAMLDAAIQLGRLPLVGRKVRALSSAAFARYPSEIVLFVNLHPDDLHDVDLIDEAAPLTQIASRVILEVTERASLGHSASLTERIARLRQLGFRLAVDDIGAGYSGLTSFTELTPEIVKIDMSLVRDVHQSALKQRTIAALCRLCHETGTLVVGEGVETAEERDTLVRLGCDLLQGYLFGRPQRTLP